VKRWPRRVPWDSADSILNYGRILFDWSWCVWDYCVMARLARVVGSGVENDVTQRGSRRLETFFCEEDYSRVCRCLVDGMSFGQVGVSRTCRKNPWRNCKAGQTGPEVKEKGELSMVSLMALS